MLTTEQVKKIAEYMYPDKWEEFDEPAKKGSTYICVGNDWFEPEGKDAMEVLEALSDECKKREILIEIGDGDILVYSEIGDRTAYFEDEFNNESICLAYLAVMESK